MHRGAALPGRATRFPRPEARCVAGRRDAPPRAPVCQSGACRGSWLASCRSRGTGLGLNPLLDTRVAFVPVFWNPTGTTARLAHGLKSRQSMRLHHLLLFIPIALALDWIGADRKSVV